MSPPQTLCWRCYITWLHSRYVHLYKWISYDVMLFNGYEHQDLLPTNNLLLSVIIVAGGQEMAKDECGDVHLLLLMLNNWNSLPIVPYLDLIVLSKQKSHKWMAGWEHAAWNTHGSMSILMQFMPLGSRILLSAAFTKMTQRKIIKNLICLPVFLTKYSSI